MAAPAPVGSKQAFCPYRFSPAVPYNQPYAPTADARNAATPPPVIKKQNAVDAIVKNTAK